MKECVLIFRMDITTEEVQPTKEQMEVYMHRWMLWINNISERGQLANGGNHFSREGKLLRSQNVITDGPYTKDKESVTGYIIIHAKNIDDAVSIANDCPILQGEGTSVEVRETATPGTMKDVKRTIAGS